MIFNMPSKKRTKIVCTIGPASHSASKLKQMVRAGMNVARLNLSHGIHADHKKLIRNIRSVARELKHPVAIIGDLQGPKIRVGELPEKGVKLQRGKTIEVPVTFENLYKDVKKGHTILLDDGLMEGEIVSGRKGFLKFKVVVGGTLTSHKGINFPETNLSISAITEKDKSDAKFCVEQKLHYVALSFVTDPADVKKMRRILRSAAKDDQPLPKVIAKIEKHEAVDRFDEILKSVDAIMVARGDLGIETAAEGVPILQKEFIDKCRAAAKPVIVATQMLDSMIRNPRPTRAEVSDVANAVIDHTDAVMLSGETATGKYPVEAVKTMTRIIEEAEASHYDDVTLEESSQLAEMVKDSVSGAASLMVQTLKTKMILALTNSGATARMVSRFRPEIPIVAIASTEFIRHQLNLSWAVQPYSLKMDYETDDLIKRATRLLKLAKLVRAGDKVVVIASHPAGRKVNMLEIREI